MTCLSDVAADDEPGVKSPTLTLLLDGIWGRPRRFAALRRTLEGRGYKTEVFRYRSGGRASLIEEGNRLAAFIRTQRSPVNVIGFSMGGLVIRAAVQNDPALPIQHAVFLNSPHGGSWLSYAVPFKTLEGIQQMRPGSDFIRDLAAMPWTIPTLAVWCPFDLMVIPGASARFAGANEIIRCNVPVHTWPIHSRAIHDRIAAFFDKPTQTKN